MTSSMTGSYPAGGRNKIPSGYKLNQINQFTPEQLQMFRQMAERLGPDSWLSKLAMGDESQFQELEAPALKQFSGELGNLASRFSGMGAGGRKSSGFQNTANQAASDFAEKLQGQRMGLRNQAMQDLMSYSNQFLQQRPHEKFLSEKSKSSGWGGLIGAGVGGLGGFLAGGPAGAWQGATMGYNVGSGF